MLNVSSHYGAPMGRRSHSDLRDLEPATKFSLCRIRINRGGYDSGGAYWGIGAPLYYAAASRADTGALIADRYFRARSRDEAKATIRKEFPMPDSIAEGRAMTFTTHTGESVTGARLQAALEAVAKDWAERARGIRSDDDYASHVTETEKDSILAQDLAFAESIAAEGAKGFTIWQRVNAKLTGECVAFLSRGRA